MSEHSPAGRRTYYRPTAGWGNATAWARCFVAEALTPGSVAVDATMGNGLDTLFLAGAVGPNGRVYSFDIQPAALHNTAALLGETGLEAEVELLLADHSRMDQYITAPVNVVMFNLGYLPGGDHGMVTTPASTITALTTALKILAPGGRLSVVAYPGHTVGRTELAAVEDLTKKLKPTEFSVQKVMLLNRASTSPVVILVEKADKKDENLATEKDTGDRTEPCR